MTSSQERLVDQILLAFAAASVARFDHQLTQFDVTCRGLVFEAEIRHWCRMTYPQYSFWIGTTPSRLIREGDLRILALRAVREFEIEEVAL